MKIIYYLCGATLFLLFIYIFLAHKDVNGQIFIVTNGASSIKLGLVDVYAINEDSLKDHINTKIKELNAKDEGIKKETLSSYEKIIDLQNSLIANLDETFYSLENNSKSELSYDINHLKKPIEEVEKDITNKKEALEYPKQSYLFDGISNISDKKTTTNADGLFKIPLPTYKRYLIVAHASRQVIGSVEDYYWIVNTNDDEQELILSNKNTLPDDFAALKLNLKDLLNI